MLNADDRRVFSSSDGADMRERVSDLLRRGRPNDANVMLEKLYKCDSRLATDAAAEIVDNGWATANTAIMLLLSQADFDGDHLGWIPIGQGSAY